MKQPNFEDSSPDVSDEQPCCERKEAADCVLGQKDEICAVWLDAVKQIGRDAEKISEPALRDDVPRIIELVASVLDRGDFIDDDTFEPARAHGEQRATLTKATVELVLEEIRLLRRVVIDHVAKAVGPLAAADLLLLYALFERISEISIRAYLEGYLSREDAARREIETNIARLQELTRMLEEERERREIFVSSIVHDLRTPLSSLQMATDYLGSGVDGPEQREKALGKMRRSIQQLSAMAQRLLDVNRITAGKRLPLEIHRVDLLELVETLVHDRHLVHTFQSDHTDIDESLIRFENHVGTGAGESLCGWWNADAIVRMVTNLVENAFKYGEPPVTVSLVSAEEGVAISVHNEGSPIPEDGRERVFERFVRLETNGDEAGWGMGLTVTRGLAQALGGQVDLESEEGLGTTFTITLPHDSRPHQTASEAPGQ